MDRCVEQSIRNRKLNLQKLLRSVVGSSMMLLQVSHCQAELVKLTIDSNPYPGASSGMMAVDAGNLGFDAIQTSISGEITIDLLPTALNPTTAQVVDFTARVDDEIDFSLGDGVLPVPITLEADASAVQLEMTEASAASPLVGGVFSQPGNRAAVQGVINSTVSDDPIDLGERDPMEFDLEEIAVARDGNTIRVLADLDTTREFRVGEAPDVLEFDVEVVGSLVAVGARPDATYTLDARSESNLAFASADHWLRNDVADTNSLPPNERPRTRQFLYGLRVAGVRHYCST